MARHAKPTRQRGEPLLGIVAALADPIQHAVAALVLTLALITTFYVGITGTLNIVGIIVTLAVIGALICGAVLAVNRWQDEESR